MSRTSDERCSTAVSRARCASGSASRRCWRARSRRSARATSCGSTPSIARPAKRWRASRRKRRAEDRVLQRARLAVVADAHEARRVAAVDAALRRADRAGDDAVADGAEGVRARPGGAAARARARVGRVLQPGDRAGPRVRLRVRDAVHRLRQPRRVAAQRRVRAARLRAAEPRERARAAVHHLSVPRPRHRQPGEGGQHARAVEGGVSARVAAGQRARR